MLARSLDQSVECRRAAPLWVTPAGAKVWIAEGPLSPSHRQLMALRPGARVYIDEFKK